MGGSATSSATGSTTAAAISGRPSASPRSTRERVPCFGCSTRWSFIFFDHSSTYDQQAISGKHDVSTETVWARVGQATLYGEFALDDFDLNPRTGRDDREIEATSYQLSLGGRYMGVSDRLEFGFRLPQSLRVVVPFPASLRRYGCILDRGDRGSMVGLRSPHFAGRLVSFHSGPAYFPRASVSAQGGGRLPHSLPAPGRPAGYARDLSRRDGDHQASRAARAISAPQRGIPGVGPGPQLYFRCRPRGSLK